MKRKKLANASWYYQKEPGFSLQMKYGSDRYHSTTLRAGCGVSRHPPGCPARSPQAFGASHAVESAKPLSFFEERLRTSRVWAARQDNTLVGLACLAPGMSDREKHKGLIWGVFISPEIRGQGVSRALLATLLNWADQHYEQVTLTVITTNTAALALYQQAGFDIFGSEPGHSKMKRVTAMKSPEPNYSRLKRLFAKPILRCRLVRKIAPRHVLVPRSCIMTLT